jgi:AmmeMemoRadiSam system protein B
MPTVRDPAVAGQFYPGDRKSLEREVDVLLQQAAVSVPEGTIRGLVSPHAGYMYSGGTAAHGYRLLEGKKFDAVVIVGPSHRDYFEGVTLFPGDAYRTPLGEVPIDREVRDALAGAGEVIKISALGHRLEHSVEVQLPFLQRVLGAFSFVPVVMGDQQRRSCDILAGALVKACRRRNVLLVASTDLSHYHPYDEAERLDRVVIDDIACFQPDRLMDHLESNQAEACGGGPVVAVMKAAAQLGASKVKILHHCNSGDIIPQRNAVVGYLSATFLQPD